jgi:hypothetical protein
MGLKDLLRKVKVELGVDEAKTVADEAAEELAKEAQKRKEEK